MGDAASVGLAPALKPQAEPPAAPGTTSGTPDTAPTYDSGSQGPLPVGGLQLEAAGVGPHRLRGPDQVDDQGGDTVMSAREPEPEFGSCLGVRYFS